ncbi:MAG TPA: flagellar hook-basal body complex protein FliE [Gammaproteobacteria bacterium]|nr:flagellar hook-basal body complex protein FliE [Gammaproteobacteria bacterium]
MSGIEPTKLLAEMQRLAASAHDGPSEPVVNGQGFADLLKASIQGVNEAQATAADMATALELGDRSVGLPEVMIALQKASLSFQAMTEVRNRLVNAYQEIMNMPI